jgi:hypothetical protein
MRRDVILRVLCVLGAFAIRFSEILPNLPVRLLGGVIFLKKALFSG